MDTAAVTSSFYIHHTVSSPFSNPSLSRPKRRRKRNTSYHKSPCKGYLALVFYVVVYYTIVVVQNETDNANTRYTAVMGMMNEWKYVNDTRVGINDHNKNICSKHSTEPHRRERDDPQHDTKQRFLRWIRTRRRRQQKKKRTERNDKFHIPMIDDPRLTFHLHPTSILSIASERRKLLLPPLQVDYRFNDNSRNTTGSSSSRILMSDHSMQFHHQNSTTSKDNIDDDDDDDDDLYCEWFSPNETSAVYATIPDQHDPKHRYNRVLHDYYKLRHLSRYEQQYRVSNHYNLQLNWNGLYDATFVQHIVHFDDDIFYSRWSEDNNSSNVTTNTKDNLFPQTQNIITTNNHSYVNTSKVRRQRRRTDHNETHPTTQHRQSLSSKSAIDNHVTYTGGIFDNYQSVPLSQGYGTHFANVWVGTPVPQRKTVIVDTGSHYTAFPCTGCKDCGAPHHTDPYYRPENSKTFQQLQCNDCQDDVPCEDSKCKFSQAYTEGSSWEAIQVRDQFYCGGTDVLDSASPTDQKYAINFMFGCQISMTGLFKTQLADGIMGMSAHPATLPKKLYDARKLEHNLFAMCYRRELGTSKRGVSAGSMTLGGVSNNLDTSPFVFAKNVVKVGWFTVYVKNIYVRSGGGQSARSVDPIHQTIKVRLNAKTLNSGKGVIVDSGTTDTYLNKRVAADFTKAWKKATGQVYSNAPLSLTPEQLRSLPTVLIQCQAFSKNFDPTIEDYDTIPGYTGSLDPTSPNDLLIAIPATSYMDYSPITQRYMSRLYFTESVGGVLGSNTMQGHNVLFDWQNGRVGFAESSCTYDKKVVPVVAQDSGFASDCKVSNPILTRACIETFDRSLCDRNPTGIALFGNETWTAIVENPGNDAGIPCFEPAEPIQRDKDPFESTIICGGQGTCEEYRPCLLTCPQVQKAAEVKPLTLPIDETKKRFRCGDTSWSACDYGCAQTKITSRAYSDGLCHEVTRHIRPCHIGACSREDPCRVPFVVHVVLAFRNGSVSKWSEAAEEILAVALSDAVSIASSHDTPLFTPGDVYVSMALPWYQDQDEYDIESNYETTKRDYSDNYNNVIIGLKVVVEISMYNPLSELPNKAPIADSEEESSSGAFVSMLRNITYLVRGRKPLTTCSPGELYALAKLTLQAKDVIHQEDFMVYLIERIKDGGNQDETRAFGPITSLTYKPSENRVVSVWTIRTGIEDKINYFGPQKAFSFRVFSILRNIFFFSTLFLLLMVTWNAITAIYSFCFGRVQPKRQANHMTMIATPRNIPYSIITRIENSNNPYDAEDSIIMGLGEDIELPNHATYKSSMATKRVNRSSPMNNKSHH